MQPCCGTTTGLQESPEPWFRAICVSPSASLPLFSCSCSAVVLRCTCAPAALLRTNPAGHAVCSSHLRWSCVEVVHCHSRFVTSSHVACADAWPAWLRACVPLFAELYMPERLCFCSACVFCLLRDLFCAFVRRACICVFSLHAFGNKLVVRAEYRRPVAVEAPVRPPPAE